MNSIPWRFDGNTASKWSRLLSVGLLSYVLDVALFQVLSAAHLKIFPAHLASFSAAAVLAYALLARRTSFASSPLDAPSKSAILGRAVVVILLALFLRWAFLIQLLESWNWPPQVAIFLAAFVGQLSQSIGWGLIVFVSGSWLHPSSSRWQALTIAAVAYTVFLRLACMGSIDLIPEEAYYWNYAQHLDWSYLDHPPMVGWLIWLSTYLLGKSELSVRLPSLFSWAVAAVFMFRWTHSLFGRDAAFRCVLLLAVLPVYFGFGFFMTPDAPLFAAWAGFLYYLHHAVISQNRRAWLGAGLCMGIGMLSKYTILLPGLSTAIYLLLHHRSRQWWARKEPYVGAALSAMIFSPVVFWNAKNGWASFIFQGPHRWHGPPEFSLLFLIPSVLLILTPVGVAAVAQVLLQSPAPLSTSSSQPTAERPSRLFALVFTLAPLSVFVLHSFRDEPKFHWTAPLWLAILPWVAQNMAVPSSSETQKPFSFMERLWVLTAAALLLILGSGFCYISLGLPGMSPISSKRLFAPWKNMGQKVDVIERKIEKETGSQPAIFGMDNHVISSELAFYDDPLDLDRFQNAGGPHLFGGRSVMWAYWFPTPAQVGKTMVMIDFRRDTLSSPLLADYFNRLSDVFQETIERNGETVGYFYWRVGYGYRGHP
jgi:dolichol-phosphate mannosyltransferase